MRHLLEHPAPELVPLAPLDVRALLAANDSTAGFDAMTGRTLDLNDLVGRVTGAWVAHATHTTARCHVVLALDAHLPPARGDAASLAFVLAGFLSLLAQDADEDAVVLRVSTQARGGRAEVVVRGPGMPRLSVLRAVLGGATATDPLAHHCARLVRSSGGSLDLVSTSAGIGVRLSLPVLPTGCSAHAREHRRISSTHLCPAA